MPTGQPRLEGPPAHSRAALAVCADTCDRLKPDDWGATFGFHEFGEAVLGKLKAKHDPPIISPIIHHLRVNELSWEEETCSHRSFDSNATLHFSTELCL